MVRLITGAGGMMGSHLYEALKDLNCDVLPTFFKSTLDQTENIKQYFYFFFVFFKKIFKKLLVKFKPDFI